VNWPAAFGWLADRHQIRLAPEQQVAVRMALTTPVSILTGGPWTGKTHSLKGADALATKPRTNPSGATPFSVPTRAKKPWRRSARTWPTW
jgi:exodeoxyribonuclease V alpha subunit